MKQKDIALIIIIAALSAVISFVVSGKVFVTPNNRQQQVQKTDAINTSFVLPDEKYFNTESINPAQTIQLGSNSNPNPFNGTSQ